jgi:1,4-alpha-glucan branching enzyme
MSKANWTMKNHSQTEPAHGKKLESVRLDFHHETARNVCIAGSFNEWNPEGTPMRCSAPGHWTMELMLAPGSYEYQYVVDGSWLNDPRAVKSTPSPYGGHNSVLVVEKGPAGDLPGNSTNKKPSTTEL